MRAMRIHGYGGPEVMRLDDIPQPAAGEGERLVRLVTASVNPIDWKMRHGFMQVPLPRTLGRDGAGIDVATGERVLGVGSPGRDGTHAEYAVFSREATAVIPAAMSFEEAAARGIAAVSAWIPLVENAKLTAGQRVLIHGGAGGVGAFALQIARQRGAEVWTTCSARNAHFCRSLGADRVIDYTGEDFAGAGPIFDAVFDTIGGDVHRRSGLVLKPGGILVFLTAAAREAVTRTDVQVKATEVRATRARLEAVLGAGFSPTVGNRFPLERAAEAYELSRTGHTVGKIVLNIAGA